MGIMDIFRGAGAQQQPAAQPQQQPQQQPAAPAANPVAGNNLVPQPGVNTPPAGTNPDGSAATSPMDNFASLWQTDPNTPAPNDPNAPLIALNQQKLAEQVRQMDFTKSVNPELFQKVAAGGEEAVTALAQIVNSVAQQATAQALVGSSMVAEGAIKKYGTGLRSEIPSLIKQQSVTEQRRQLNPALSNPAFEPMVQVVEMQMRKKFPDATAAELTEQVSKYFDTFAAAATAPATAAAAAKSAETKAATETDWGAFMGEPGYDISKF